MKTSTLFSTQNLSLEYTTGKQTIEVIHNCNISIPEGKATIIFGASGSGKSSLLNVLSGLQKPTQGSLHYRDTDVYERSLDELAHFRAQDLGIVYQTNYWIKSLNVIDNVAIPLYFQGLGKVAAHNQAMTALKRVNMPEYAHKYPFLLSGGEQQRIAIARAIASDPPVIIADEPTGSLDSKNGDIIIDLLQQLQKESNKTIILVTHNMEYLYIADHLLEVQDGLITEVKQSLITNTVENMLQDTQKRILSLTKKHSSYEKK
ncbi:MAG: ABC transporter ATP-binding protein [Candidatus Saccharimonadales bacterium]